MTLLFVDGFDHYATADIAKKWGSGGSGTIAASGRRGGGAYVSGSGSSGWISKTFAATDSFVVGAAVNFSNTLPTSTSHKLFSLLDGGTLQCDVRVNSNGTISITRNGTVPSGGTSILTLSNGQFYYIEWKVTIADSIGAGTCKVRVNGVDWITVATGQDLKNTANATANEVRVGNTTANGVGSVLFDDFYLCNQSGSTNNDFLGDCRIDTLFPNADGTYTDFTPSAGSDHFALVDETAPNTTDYVDGGTVGNRDSFQLGNLAALSSQVVYGVQVNAAMNKDDAGAKSAATMVRSGSTNEDGASAALSTSQSFISQVFEQDPAAAAAWTETTVNTMQAGVVVTA